MVQIPLEPLLPEERVPATPERIQELERLTGFALPADYRAFLDEHGGSAAGNDDGYVVAPYPLPGGKQGFATVDAFYGFYRDANDAYDLRSVFATYRGRVPLGSFSIAQTPGGHQICVVGAGEATGSVLVWDHERGTRQPLAASFAEFLTTLRLQLYPDV